MLQRFVGDKTALDNHYLTENRIKSLTSQHLSVILQQRPLEEPKGPRK